MIRLNWFRVIGALSACFLLAIGVPSVSAPHLEELLGPSMQPEWPASTTLSIGSGDVTPGGSITVPLVASLGRETLGAVTVEIEYDPAVVDATGCSRDPGGVLDLAMCNANMAAGKVGLTAVSTAGVSGDVVLAKVTFRAVGSVGESSELKLTAGTFADPAGQPLGTTVEDGQITIRGDPDTRIYLPLVVR